MLLRRFLQSQPFADQIEIVGKKDTEETGNFEVVIGPDRQYVHSKRKAGQGRCESDKEKQMICEFIEEYLEENCDD